jgi:hypothetical protein
MDPIPQKENEDDQGNMSDGGFDRGPVVRRLHLEFPFLNASVVLEALANAERQVRHAGGQGKVEEIARAILKE